MDVVSIDIQDTVGPEAIGHQHPGGIGLQEFKAWWAFIYRQTGPRWHRASGIQDLVGIGLWLLKVQWELGKWALGPSGHWNVSLY